MELFKYFSASASWETFVTYLFIFDQFHCLFSLETTPLTLLNISVSNDFIMCQQYLVQLNILYLIVLNIVNIGVNSSQDKQLAIQYFKYTQCYAVMDIVENSQHITQMGCQFFPSPTEMRKILGQRRWGWEWGYPFPPTPSSII